MRIIVEIDAGKQGAVNAVPSGITITFQPEAAALDATFVPATEPAAVATLEGEQLNAGPAPSGDAASAEPEAFSDTALAMEVAGEAGALDAGAAPVDDMAPGETAVLDAGAAPVEDSSFEPGEAVAFTESVAFPEPESDSAADEYPQAVDSGAASRADLASSVTGEAINAGSAVASPEGEVGAEAEAVDTGIGDLNAEPSIDAGAAPAELFAEPSTAPAAEADDLTVIKGIGPRSAAALMVAGITTYAQLAASSEGELRQIMGMAGIPANVGSWADQAQALS